MPTARAVMPDPTAIVLMMLERSRVEESMKKMGFSFGYEMSVRNAVKHRSTAALVSTRLQVSSTCPGGNSWVCWVQWSMMMISCRKTRLSRFWSIHAKMQGILPSRAATLTHGVATCSVLPLAVWAALFFDTIGQ